MSDILSDIFSDILSDDILSDILSDDILSDILSDDIFSVILSDILSVILSDDILFDILSKCFFLNIGETNSQELNHIFTSNLKGMPPHLSSMELEYTDLNGASFTYDNFHLTNLESRNFNPSLKRYSEYLRENDYTDSESCYDYFNENSQKTLNHENFETSKIGGNDFSVFIISLKNLTRLNRAHPELFLQTGIISRSPLRLRLNFVKADEMITNYFVHTTWLSTWECSFTGNPKNQSISIIPKEVLN
jgi:hypothetical protein